MKIEDSFPSASADLYEDYLVHLRNLTVAVVTANKKTNGLNKRKRIDAEAEAGIAEVHNDNAEEFSPPVTRKHEKEAVTITPAEVDLVEDTPVALPRHKGRPKRPRIIADITELQKMYRRQQKKNSTLSVENVWLKEEAATAAHTVLNADTALSSSIATSNALMKLSEEAHCFRDKNKKLTLMRDAG